ncbi:hypothetical protein H257_10958 [Aphanomyces astaci]|uniref:Uncharacterized protein n=1 Tax=Aphanomyces astaci TaxID=112090 RepID=W4G5N1_APHAT|nr:hypothetical protein H257_10958 [Aphanomyces astaci]ETV74364.1 hypothetical protein H257_10958 [Aphanomyces astaci]|eukprot:XP_009836022.1 hypothetical protein H257_10958 [Aphanomyces astaci]
MSWWLPLLFVAAAFVTTTSNMTAAAAFVTSAPLSQVTPSRPTSSIASASLLIISTSTTITATSTHSPLRPTTTTTTPTTTATTGETPPTVVVLALVPASTVARVESSPPLCDPVSCRVLLTMGGCVVLAVATLVGWQVYQRYAFRREREQFQLRESELRSAVEESISSSRSLRSIMTSSTSVQV